MVDHGAGAAAARAQTPLSLGIAAIAGFFLFRFFDVAKPWPVRRFEELHGGVGIMADDVAAACYAAIVLGLALFLISELVVQGRSMGGLCSAETSLIQRLDLGHQAGGSGETTRRYRWSPRPPPASRSPDRDSP